MLVESSLFPTGRLVQTSGARDELVPADVEAAMHRHRRGDWGDLGLHDREANDNAILDLGRLASVYHDRAGKKFYIVTEADRSATTVMLPEEY